MKRAGWGFSNSNPNEPDSVTLIYRNPFSNIPRFVVDGHEEALAGALNLRNRRAKAYKFTSSESEDHVTWTLFRYLVHEHKLSVTMQRLGVVSHAAQEPALLLWGVPIPSDSAPALITKQHVNAVSDALGESPESRSEPDVILDFADHGVVFIEVKLCSGNDSLKPASPKWNRYLKGSDAFADGQKAKASGLYELCRNWRIVFDVANNRPAMLINLGPETLWSGEKAALKPISRVTDTPRRMRIPYLFLAGASWQYGRSTRLATEVRIGPENSCLNV